MDSLISDFRRVRQMMREGAEQEDITPVDRMFYRGWYEALDWAVNRLNDYAKCIQHTQIHLDPDFREALALLAGMQKTERTGGLTDEDDQSAPAPSQGGS